MKLNSSKYSLTYDKGSLRWIKSGEVEIIRMIYSAVRDHNWGTIEPEIIAEEITENLTGFQIKTQIKYQKVDIHFEAEYTITGSENCLIFEMNGEAKSTFRTNRVGCCVLHPIKECSGKTYMVTHPDGTMDNAVFPELISPVQPMLGISGLEWEPAGGILAKLSFSGEIFEMEDQRNWTDASYKTYCRPLSMPFPFEIKKGEKIHQKIVLEIKGETQNEIGKSNFTFNVDGNKIFRIPEIGISASSRNEPIENTEAYLLKNLPINHLRAEILLFEQNWKSVLKRAIAESKLLGIPMFLVVYFSENFEDEIKQFRLIFQNQEIKVKYILPVGKNHLTNDLIFDSVFAELKFFFPETKIGAGVNAYFAELNRNRPQSLNAGFISFTICPQVHAFDNVSLVENLEAQKHAVDSARKLFPGKPVFVSPVALKQRFNVVETSSETGSVAEELPSQVDTRQNSNFAAQWLLGSLKNLTQSGTNLVTYFETVGWRGFIMGNYATPVMGKFKAERGDIFPIYSVIGELTGFSELIYSVSSHPLLFDGVIVKSATETKIFLFSFSDNDIEIEIKPNINAGVIKSFSSGKISKIDNGHILLRANDLLMIYIK